MTDRVGGLNSRSDIINVDAYWKDIRMEYSDGNLVYKGVHTDHNSATSDTGWEIWKYTWSGDGPTRIEGPLSGAWDNRATLSWG